MLSVQYLRDSCFSLQKGEKVKKFVRICLLKALWRKFFAVLSIQISGNAMISSFVTSQRLLPVIEVFFFSFFNVFFLTYLYGYVSRNCAVFSRSTARRVIEY